MATLLTLFLNAGVPPGAKIVARSDEPLLHAFSELIGAGMLTDWLPLLIGVGALSTAHSTLYAAGRSIFALGRAGYLPVRLGRTRDGVPTAALLAAAACGWAAALLVDLSARALPVADVLIDMTALAAVASYALQFLSFIVLRRRHPSMARPFVSPLGATGAMTGLLIALFCLTLLFANRGYWPALLVGIALLGLGALWFHWAGRPDARAPEEAFAERLAHEPPAGTSERLP